MPIPRHGLCGPGAQAKPRNAWKNQAIWARFGGAGGELRPIYSFLAASAQA